MNKVLNIISHLARLTLSSSYRKEVSFQSKLREEKKLIRAIPRYTDAMTNILGRPVKMVDSASFLYMYDEVFDRQIYRFESQTDRPRIIDGGANIGLSVLYFKQLYPECRIAAFEPDAHVFEVLQDNVNSFGYDDIECIRKALWSSETTLEFLHEGADGGRFPQAGDTGRISSIPTVSLRSYLTEPVDFLKLDVEGAETEVLKDCEDLLGNVRYLFVEYHSFVNKPQSLDTVIGIMAGAGFRLHIHPPLTSPQPFYRRSVHFGMDMQLNIFGFRE